MTGEKRKIAILWHMHQPFYKNPYTGKMELPWVRLHGLKDYYGMVALLNDFPRIKATYNLVPSLLVQLECYLKGEKDIFQELFIKEAETLTPHEVGFLVRHFFSAHYPNLIKPFPRFRYLYRKKKRYKSTVRNPGDWCNIFSPDELRDLQVWYPLCHFDEQYKTGDERVKGLIRKGRHFSESDKRIVREVEMELLGKIIPEYKKLADAGQIEISTTPFYHPILPLLLDPQLGRAANPHLPEYDLHFNWKSDARHHMERALQYMEKTFGRVPTGIWPSEGSLSGEVLEMLEDLGVKWAATDETNLSQSLDIPIERDGDFIVTNPGILYKPYVLEDGSQNRRLDITLFFRDCHLSDLIGFHYRKMPYKKAAADLVERIKRIPQVPGGNMVVPIILDGENAWEYYSHGGRNFLGEFFRLVSEDDSLETVTFSEVLDMGIEPGVIDLQRYSPGSWISGNFDIWIGDEEDRKGWKLLEKARAAFQEGKARLSDEQSREAQDYLSIAQGSDWFWWFGKENYTADLDIFDNLFRKNMQKVYDILGQEAPPEFFSPVSTASPGRSAGIRVELPSGPLTPRLDGRPGSVFQWLHAGKMESDAFGGAMNIVNPLANTLYYGFDRRYFYLRIDTEKPAARYFEEGYTLDVILRKRKKPFRFPVVPFNVDSGKKPGDRIHVGCAVAEIIELSFPLALLKLTPGDTFYCQLEWTRDGHHFQSLPSHDFFRLIVPTVKDYACSWQA